jgi:ABC-2 type transport system ATP-binding protein
VRPFRGLVRPRRGRRATSALLLSLLPLSGLLVLAPPASAADDVVTEDAMVDSGSGADAVRLDTTLYVPASAEDDPAPAVVLAHGFGGSKQSVADDALDLAERGYVVLTYSARGFGRSTGQIGLNDPRYEIADLSTLIDLLADHDEVLLDGTGDPRVGVAGGSYGGALSLLGAAYDDRIDAIAPQITWNSLTTALFPSQTGPVEDAGTVADTPQTDGVGVYKRLWAGLFFGVGSVPIGGVLDSLGLGGVGGDTSGESPEGAGAPTDAPGLDPASADPEAVEQALTCGRFRLDICAAYQAAAATGTLTPEVAAVLDRSSPAAVLDRIDAPTLLIQGTQDSLFGLGQADANARGIAANGTPVKVVWFPGGHDSQASDRVTADLREQVAGWFDYYLRSADDPQRGDDPGTGFEFPAPTGIASGLNVQGGTQTIVADAYPGIEGAGPAQHRTIAVSGRAQPVVTPAGGTPAAITTVPGLGSLGSALGGAAVEIPGQFAAFGSEPLDAAVEVVGAPTVGLTVSSASGSATLFAKLYDVAPGGGMTLPSGLVAPLALTDLSTDPTDPTQVEVTLPGIVHRFEAGHTMRVVVSSTDQAFALPAEAAVYSVGLAGASAELTVPQVTGDVAAQAGSSRWWVLLGVVVALALIGWAVATLWGRRRRRRVSAVEPDGEDVPLRFQSVTKAYKDGFVAVRDLSFEVRRGQVLGLLGPNGAGKTTSLRMLMGLIRPTEGRISVFGHDAGPGAPVLSRLGSFVEGTGLQPHLSGRDNLRLYWAATGRPAADAHMEEAIAVAGLGTAIDRPVRRYSQGMRQRVAIAQAMLGLPDLLVLDEPTNGLDPPQIHAMREVLRSYAATGRTVIVSSHLLAEIEQTCSHVVVMAKGQKIAQGTVEEIVGTGGAVSVGLVDDAETDRAIAVLEGLPGVTAERTDEGLVAELDGTSRARTLQALVEAGIEIDQFTPRRRLEDAFLALVGDS